MRFSFFRNDLLGLGFLYSFSGWGRNYVPDVLGHGFEQTTIQQADDYEGKVTCTLLRKLPVGPTSRAVLYIHGFNDYFFQQQMADSFLAEGFRFYAIDLRKYGRSWLPNQKLNNVRDLHEYEADIDSALHIMQSENPGQVLLCGHSTGGLIAALYAAHHQQTPLFSALFLNSPFFDMNMPGIVEAIGVPAVAKKGKKHPDKLIKGGLTKWYGWSLHKDAKGEWDYNLAWKPHDIPAVNCGWIRAIHLGQQELQKGISISQPVLVMHSDKSFLAHKWTDRLFTADAVLDVKDIHQYAGKINNGACTILTIPGGMHDLVLSKLLVRTIVYQKMFDWVNAQAALQRSNPLPE